MALATVKTGDTATAAQYNALVNLLNGAAGAENPVVLADNIAGTLQLKPTNDPGSVVELVQVSNAGGTRLATIRSDGAFMSTVGASVAGISTTTLYASSNASIAGYLNVGGTFLATGAATLSGALNVVGATTLGSTLNVAGTAFIGTLPTISNGQLNVATGSQAQFDLQNTVTGATPSAGSHWRLFADNQGGGGGNLTVGLFDVSNAATRWGIDNSGRMGIGTTTPAALLDVNGGMIARSAATLGSTLNVTGATTLAGSTTITGSVNIAQQLEVGNGTPNAFLNGPEVLVQNTGEVRFHMFNGGAVAEWVLRQPAHATGDYAVFSKLVGNTYTDMLFLYPSGGAFIGTSGAADPGVNNLVVKGIIEAGAVLNSQGTLSVAGVATMGSTLNVVGALTGAGRISSNTVGASAKTLLSYVPIRTIPTVFSVSGNASVIPTNFTLTGVPASAVAVNLRCLWVSASVADQALIVDPLGGSPLQQLVQVGGTQIWFHGVVGCNLGTMQYQTIVSGGAANWTLEVWPLGYYEAA